MTPTEIAALCDEAEKALEGTTQGPWGGRSEMRYGGLWWVTYYDPDRRGYQGNYPFAMFLSQADAWFCSSSRTLVPRLVSALKQLDEENRNLLTTVGQHAASRKELETLAQQRLDHWGIARNDAARYREALLAIRDYPNSEDDHHPDECELRVSPDLEDAVCTCGYWSASFPMLKIFAMKALGKESPP